MRPTLRAVAFWASVGAIAPAGRTVGAAGARAEPDSVSTNTARVARIEAVIHPAVRREGLVIHDARRFVKGITLWSKARACGSAQQVREPPGRSILFCLIKLRHASSNHIARNRDGFDGVARHRAPRNLDSYPVPAAGRRAFRSRARSSPAVYSYLH